MEPPNYFEIINKLNEQQVWIPKRINMELTNEQYQALLKGYEPHWEMRYGILFNKGDGYFYAYRSGFVVGKYKFENTGSVYICTEMFENSDRPDCLQIFEIVQEACYQNKVTLDLSGLKRYLEETKSFC